MYVTWQTPSQTPWHFPNFTVTSEYSLFLSPSLLLSSSRSLSLSARHLIATAVPQSLSLSLQVLHSQIILPRTLPNEVSFSLSLFPHRQPVSLPYALRFLSLLLNFHATRAHSNAGAVPPSSFLLFYSSPRSYSYSCSFSWYASYSCLGFAFRH